MDISHFMPWLHHKRRNVCLNSYGRSIKCIFNAENVLESFYAERTELSSAHMHTVQIENAQRLNTRNRAVMKLFAGQIQQNFDPNSNLLLIILHMQRNCLAQQNCVLFTWFCGNSKPKLHSSKPKMVIRLRPIHVQIESESRDSEHGTQNNDYR